MVTRILRSNQWVAAVVILRLCFFFVFCQSLYLTYTDWIKTLRPCGARVISGLWIDYSHDRLHFPVFLFDPGKKRKSFRFRMLWPLGMHPPVDYRMRRSIFKISKPRMRSANLKIRQNIFFESFQISKTYVYPERGCRVYQLKIMGFSFIFVSYNIFSICHVEHQKHSKYLFRFLVLHCFT